MPEKQNIELEIKGMTCDSCATHVIESLNLVEGVDNVEIPDWSKGHATVKASFDISEDKLIKAVKNVGYSAKVKTLHVVNKKKTPQGNNDYDLIVIGTGGAGMGAAIKAAESGHTCAIIEAGVVGGTCVNVGCVPSKALLRAAEAYHNAGHNPFKGVHTEAVSVDWKIVVGEKDSLVEELRNGKYLSVIDSYPEITLIKGTAKLQSDGSVIVDKEKVYRSENVIIATGAKPRILPLEGIENVDVLTSTSLMELTELPRSMIIIGGRFIALEQAQIFARFGTKVTILQRSNRLIPEHEPEISDGIKSYFEEEGISVQTKAKPLAIREENGEKIITALIDGKKREFRAEHVLMAVGRTGNTQQLGLENSGVATDEHGAILVNDNMITSNPNIYAAGDVTNRPQLIYVAAAAGGIAAENALGLSEKQLDLTILPEVIFTDPQIATVGLTEAQAKQQGYTIKTSQIPMEYVPRAIAARNTRGLIKLVAIEKSDRLIGAHVLAPEGAEMIQTAAMAIHAGIKYGFTVQDMRQMLFPYLVQTEGLKLAALTFNKAVSQLSCCAA